LTAYLLVGIYINEKIPPEGDNMVLQGDTKEQILNIGENLLLNLGYNGFSYKHISLALKIKNASIHYHYPQKSDLGVAIIKRARERFTTWTKSQKIQEATFPEKLDELFLLFRRFLNAEGQVCFAGSLETDFKTLPVEMQLETRGYLWDMLKWSTNLLKEGRDHGVFNYPGDPKNQALVILTSLQGALQTARATDESCFDAIAKQIRNLVNS
jgi:TetR/AcrR family transcriptional regulator, transcriptional repressor for nem operon